MTVHHGLSELLTRRIGVRIRPDQQLVNIQSFIASRMEQLELRSPDDYLALLRQQPLDGAEFSHLIAAVTNPHSYFFRDSDQLAALRSLLLSWRRSAIHGRPLLVWSAGCATGEEPYSIAMLCADLGVEVQILATDIRGDGLELAQRATYRPWSLRHLPAAYRDRFTTPVAGAHLVDRSIRERVTFRFHNLVDGFSPRPVGGEAWDWILCRNVLIYLDRPIVQRVVRSLSEVIAPDGWLFLSSTESLHGFSSPFVVEQVEGSFCYRLQGVAAPDRPAEPEPEPARRPPWIDLPPAVDVEPAVRPGATEDSYLDALSLLEAGDRAGALARLEHLLEADPDHLRARVTLGNLHLQAHAFEEALAAYREAQDRAPLLAEIHHLMGVVYRKLNDLERASHALRQALFLQPGFWCASFLLAGVHSRLDRPQERALNLKHTLSVLEDPARLGSSQLYTSHVQGMRDLELDPTEVAQLCRRYLSEPTS
jgi:chemotaxis protein methyltransferase CheR